MRTSTALSSSVLMVSHSACILEYSHIQLTIQKSKYSNILFLGMYAEWDRVLLASLHNLGACPCPRCKVEKSQILELGMKRDKNRRLREEQVDNDSYRRKVKSARQYIFEQGKGIESAAVEDLLSEESYVPITVSMPAFLLVWILIVMHCTTWMLFLRSYLHLVLMYFWCWPLTSFTNSSSASGKPYSHISYGSWWHTAQVLFKLSITGK